MERPDQRGDEAEIDLGEEPAEVEAEAVLRGLLAFNEPYLGPSDFRRLTVMAKVGGALVGGLIGETGRGFLSVELFWVAAERRGQGLGTRLLTAAEAEARRRGCHSAYLDTYDFQARPFYERLGYRLFGELAGFPGGRRRFYLVKRLTTEGEGAATAPTPLTPPSPGRATGTP
jgi:GNAT superfamily N-acetyltransferase